MAQDYDDNDDYGRDGEGRERWGHRRSRGDGDWRDNRGDRGFRNGNGFGRGGQRGRDMSGRQNNWNEDKPGVRREAKAGIRGRYTIRDVQINPGLYNDIQEIAKADNISFYQVVRDAVTEYVAHRKGVGGEGDGGTVAAQ